jgi:hypothetical protein
LFAGVSAIGLSLALLVGCGGGGTSFNDDLRAALGDELADCLEDNLDDETIETLNEDGIELDVMSEATAEAYGAALTVCAPESSG